MLESKLDHPATMGNHTPSRCILNAALPLFVDKGYASTSIDDIVQAGGSSELHSTINSYTKETIASALLQSIQMHCKQHIFVVLTQKDVTLAQQRYNFLAVLEQFLDDVQTCALPVILASEQLFADAIQTYWLAWQQAFVQLLQPYHEADQTRQFAQNLLAQMQGALLLTVCQSGKEYVEYFIQQIKVLTQENAGSAQQTQKLRDQQHAIQTLASSIAHELRSPLTAISLNVLPLARILPILADGYRQAEQVKLTIKPLPKAAHLDDLGKPLARIKKSVKEANDMIQMILDTLKATFQQQDNPQDLENFSVSACISDALAEYPFTSPAQAELVHWQVNGFNFQVQGNPLLFKHVLFNLLHNALEIIEVEGKGDIMICLQHKDGMYSVHVKDTARGLPLAAQQQLFNQFYSKRKGGTGIGLAFCRLIMQAWQGDIHCQAVEGEYTEFVLRFPAYGKAA